MTTRGTILITDCDHPSIDVERDILSAAGWTVTLARCKTAADVVAAGEDATALIVQYAPITGAVLRALPGVRAVGRYGVGLDTVDTVAAAELGVAVRNVPDYCVDEVADHTLGLILALTRGIVALDRGVQQGTWDFRLAGRVRRASSQRLGIVGLGRIGSALAQRALAIGYDVVGCDPRGPGLTGLTMTDLPSGAKSAPATLPMGTPAIITSALGLSPAVFGMTRCNSYVGLRNDMPLLKFSSSTASTTSVVKIKTPTFISNRGEFILVKRVLLHRRCR
jgi:hypothetical protein